jgi:dihydrofolate reductase
MTIQLIVAMDENGGIGYKGDMPWGRTMKADLNRFKEITMGSAIVMGRKTFESLPKVLPGRKHYVISRTQQEHPDSDVEFLTQIHPILFRYYNNPNERCFIIGGAEIYKLFEAYIERVYLTMIHHSFEVDTVFPFDLNANTIVNVPFVADEDNKYKYSFATFNRTSL